MKCIRVVVVCGMILTKFHLVAAQESRGIPLPNGGETCNVVNLHCGAPSPNPDPGPLQIKTGPPGKAGVAGPKGQQGVKGSKGAKGSTGNDGRNADAAEILTKTNNMLGVASCKELKTRQGITTPGYYLMKSPESMSPMYVYCDFAEHAGITTCHELQQQTGTTKSGIYSFRPSGSNNSFEVFCNFESGIAVTEVWHAEMHEIRNPRRYTCDGNKGCYSWSPTYSVPWEQIEVIVSNSFKCQQFIKDKCFDSVLLESGYSWWVSREGERMNYWGGATSVGYCSCGHSGSCVNKDKKCNCDANRKAVAIDEGYLTDKAKLPVRELRFGDLDQAFETVWHTLGKLECWNL